MEMSNSRQMKPSSLRFILSDFPSSCLLTAAEIQSVSERFHFISPLILRTPLILLIEELPLPLNPPRPTLLTSHQKSLDQQQPSKSSALLVREICFQEVNFQTLSKSRRSNSSQF